LGTIPDRGGGPPVSPGLGHEFLAHVERCRMLIHLVEVEPLEGDPAANYEAVRAELGSYGAGLGELPELVVLSKRDLLADEDVEAAVAEWEGRLAGAGRRVLAVSSATGEGLDALRREVMAALPGAEAAAAPEAAPEPEFEVDFRVFRPEGEGGYSVEREGDGAYRVHGRGVEMLFERHDVANEEALAYLEQRLNEMGVVSALRSAGFEAGDEVRIGEHEFELHPG
jgi:GTPase